MTIELTSDEVILLIRALGSHEYWQLADPEYRYDGFVLEPGASGPEAQAEIAQVSELSFRLQNILDASGASQ